MQLVQEVNQELLSRYVGGEVIIENGTVLTRGTAVSLAIQGDLIAVSLKDTSWKTGSLKNIDVGEWSDTAPRATSVLLSMSIESTDGDVLLLHPSPHETKAQLTPRVR